MTTTETSTTRRWALDPSRSTVEFSVRTFWGLQAVNGHFDSFNGSYARGAAGPEVQLTIDATSVDTGNRWRDGHLRSGQFFGAAEHPWVRFSSTSVAESDDGTVHVMGNLHAAGTAVPLDFYATIRDLAGELEIEATTTVDQHGFRMSSGPLRMIRTPARLNVRAFLA